MTEVENVGANARLEFLVRSFWQNPNIFGFRIKKNCFTRRTDAHDLGRLIEMGLSYESDKLDREIHI